MTTGRHAMRDGMAGLLGGASALAMLLAARTGGGPPGVLELIADAVVLRVPPWLFAAAVASLGGLAKGLLFAGICAGFLTFAMLTAVVLGRLGVFAGQPRTPAWIASWMAVAAGLAAVGELLVLPAIGAGILGTGIVSDQAAVHVPLVLACLTYAAIVSAWSVGGVSTSAPSSSVSRRKLLAVVAGAAGSIAFVWSSATVVSRALAGAAKALPGSRDPAGADGFGFTRAVTPVESFYVVSKDYVALRVDPATWRLMVKGLVDMPHAYTLDELRSLPSHEAYRTLQCISASSISRSELIGNQRWKGVRLRDLLDVAGVHPAATFVLLRCADGYHESLRLDVAVEDETWLAYEMGPPGTLLTPDHGFPLRLLVADRYGMKQPKYVTDVILSDRDEPGWWVKGGWQTDATVRTYCRIDIPAADGISDGVLVGYEFTAFGVASAGDRGVSRVEISLDDGRSWRDADLEPLGGPLGPLTWVRWRAPVRFDKPGNTRFVARATDGTGTVQDDPIEDAFPRGSSGFPRVPMTIYAGIPDRPAQAPPTPAPTTG